MRTTIIPPLGPPFGPSRAAACSRRVRRCLLLGLVTACLLGITVGSAAAAMPTRVQAIQELAVLLTAHGAHREPGAGSQVSFVPANRPITGEQTTLPVIGHSTGPGGARWLEVMLPGRPDGSTGWIAQDDTRELKTGWRILVDLAARRLRVYHDGYTVRTFHVVVGKPSTPTPTGQFFVEETVQMPVDHPGGPTHSPSAHAPTCCRNSKAGQGRSRSTDEKTSEEHWAPPNHMAASAWPPQASTGWPPVSAQAHQ